MRTLIAFSVLLVGFLLPFSVLQAQESVSSSKTEGAASVAATKEEVDQLRNEVAAQRQTIEELKALVEKLAEGKAQANDNSSAQIHPVSAPASPDASSLPVDARAQGTPRLINAVLLDPEPMAAY